MKKLYACPYCGEEHSGIATSWEDSLRELGYGFSSIFECAECREWFTGEDGFIGYEGQPDDNPGDDIPSGNPDLDEVTGGR